MAGPIFVAITGVFMFSVTEEHTTDLAPGDYYKDDKYIEIQPHRGEETVKRQIQVQILISSDMNAAKVFVSGRFDTKQSLNLLLMHPTCKAGDQTVRLRVVTAGPQNDRMEYEVVFKPLRSTSHWYLRVEDVPGVWRVENKWVVSQGDAVNLIPMGKLFDNGKQAASTEQ